MAASEALRSQVAAKWRDGFARLNRSEPGISGLMAFSQAWNLATDYLRPKDISDPASLKQYSTSTHMVSVKAAFDMINRCRRLPVMLETFLDDICSHYHLITREIVQHLTEYEECGEPSVILRLIFRLVEWYRALGPTIRAAYTLTFQTQLFSVFPPGFVSGFKALCASTLPPYPTPPGTWESFEVLGLADRYEAIIASVGYEHIEAYVHETCAGKWGEPVLEGLRAWMTECIVPWMLPMYAKGALSTEDARNMLQNVGSRFDFHMNKTLCDLRTSEIFDIIIDFPDSMGALQDLKECLQRVDQRASLVQALRRANRKRLLHPGADTKLILTQYVATIKCLRIVDPPGVLLFKVADPIRRYLRERPDTIRSINEPIQPLQQSEIEDYNDPNWEPEPIDAGPDFRTNKPSDVISTLVSIYDSKDLFVKELQVLLAQRLLAITTIISRRWRRRLFSRSLLSPMSLSLVAPEHRILKIRFGEAALQVCEVMLKDMTDSKRIDGHVQSQKASIVHPTIISRHFWPSLESSDIVMPGQFQQLQSQYAKEFSTFKPDKKLRWLPHLGTVHLELQLEDRTIETDVPPLEAAFIELFSKKANIWSMDELIAGVGAVDRTAALKALITWVDLGVLKEDEENMFRLLEVKEEAAPTRSGTALSLHSPNLITQADQMRLYWKFIEGMLTNLGTLPLDRIQTMLRFAPGYDQTIEQLAGFMEAARREGLVVGRDGMWKLNR
ncbi:ubiquitin-protein ligase [Mycena sp. CBHHK59/15]|nr:ubiquitin-protein ligase [Mycena sp. CBHHK59/15]